MFDWLEDNKTKTTFILQYILGIFLIGYVGYSYIINSPAQTNIYCSKNNDLCVVRQQTLDITLYKDEFNISSIQDIKLDSKLFGDKNSPKDLSVQYDMIINLDNKSKPLVYMLSPRGYIADKVKDIEKSQNFINRFKEFIINSEQSTLNINISNDFATFIFILFGLVFIASIIWPMVLGKIIRNRQPLISEQIMENGSPDNTPSNLNGDGCANETNQTNAHKLLNPKLELFLAIIAFIFAIFLGIWELQRYGIF